jgi:hypothetical protein
MSEMAMLRQGERPRTSWLGFRVFSVLKLLACSNEAVCILPSGIRKALGGTRVG